ncbi:MAG TPA: zinc-dependent alcohol dehydrogenase family protein [Tepidisphaeraceae bacterium]
MVLEQNAAPIEAAPLVLRDLPVPEPGAGELRVKVSVCALCRTDLHVIEGDLPPLRRPLVPGHQAVGVVDALGAGCAKLRVGQRVGIAWLAETDGTCLYCRRGRENLCPNSRYMGYHRDGGYAEFATVREDYAYELPDELGDDVAVSPLLCAGLIGYRAMLRASVPAGGRLLLIGFGSSAHVVMQVALHRGYRVFVVTRGEGHRRLAEEMGAAWTGPDFAGLPEKADGAILFAPSGSLVPPTLESLDRGGILALAGIYMSDVPGLNYQRHLFHDREIRSVEANTRAEGRQLLAEATAARVRPRTTTYPLSEANEALLEMKRSAIDGTGVLVLR